ncbi:uncharacterized protein JCM15063_003034 [Sporobolomyces koalae]|uniref:uncharacterized protein n=1 Tax=Sporobolomyces koalae TaxID=500713 RepID=UPI003177863B
MCNLVLIKHVRDGLDCPTLVLNAFDNRLFAEFATSMSDTTKSSAVKLDWIAAKVIVQSPELLLVAGKADPFDVSTAALRRDLELMSPAGRTLLSTLSGSRQVLRHVRDALATVHLDVDVSGVDNSASSTSRYAVASASRTCRERDSADKRIRSVGVIDPKSW